MIEFIIKTLDGKDTPLSMEEGSTVLQLKQKLMELMGSPIDHQRLIFCGKLLQDDKTLDEYRIHGKAVHMVEREPPGLETRTSAPPEREVEVQRDRTMASVSRGLDIEDQPGYNLSSTASRLEVLQLHINEIRAGLDRVRSNESDEPRTFRRDDLLESTSSASGSRTEDMSNHVQLSPLLFQLDSSIGNTRAGRGIRIRGMNRDYQTPLNDFAGLIEQLEQLEYEFAPYRIMYTEMLRDANQIVEMSEALLQRKQRSGEIIAQIFHSIGHAYHAISDIGLNLSHRHSRLVSEPILRQNLPPHTHISVVQSTSERRARSTNTAAAATGSRQPDYEAVVNTQAGTNSGQDANSFEPIGYQFEIAAGVPIPINIGSANGSGQAEGQAQNRNTLLSQTQVHIQANVHNYGHAYEERQFHLPLRREISIGLHNMLRRLEQGTGYQVIMNVDDVQNATVSISQPPADSAASGSQSGLGPELYLAQMPGVVPTDMFQNFLSTVIGQGLMQGMGLEGLGNAQILPILGVVEGRALNQGEDDYQNQGQAQDQSQDQTPTDGHSVSATESPTESPIPSQNQRSQTRTSSSQPQAQQVQASNQHIPRSRFRLPPRQTAPRPRPETISIHTLVYDRFMPCDSHHARRQLQRRREAAARAGGLMLRDSSRTRSRLLVETLYDRYSRYGVTHEGLMIATLVTLREATALSNARALNSGELEVMRLRLRVYIREVINGEYEQNTQEQLADALFQRQSSFFARLPNMTPMRHNIDIIASIRAVFVRYLNESVMIIFHEDEETYSRRLRIIVARLFFELCGVVSYCCLEGVEGLRVVFRTFVSDLIEDIDEPVRNLMHSVSQEALESAILRIDHNKIHPVQFIRWREQEPSIQLSSDSDESYPLDEEDRMSSQPPGIVDERILRHNHSFPSLISLARLPNIDPSTIRSVFEEMSDAPSELDFMDSDMESLTGPTYLSAQFSPPRTTAPQANPSTSRSGPYVAVSIAASVAAFGPGTSAAPPAPSAPSAPAAPTAPPAPAASTAPSAPAAPSPFPPSAAGAYGLHPGFTTFCPYGPYGMYGPGDTYSRYPRYSCLGPQPFAPIIRPAPPAPPAQPAPPAPPAPPAADDMPGLDIPVSSIPLPPPIGPVAPAPPPLSIGEDSIPEVSALGVFGSDTDEETEETGSPQPQRDQRLRLAAAAYRRGRASRSYRSSRNSRSNQNNRPSTTRPTDSRPTDSSGNVRFVPPAQIAQNWGEEWVPTFTRDMQRQRDTTEPFSDAYITGMPPKKRRCVRQSRPPTTLNAFINESVSEVTSEVQAGQGEELRIAFREHMRSIARARAAASEDYEPSRLLATAKFLDETRTGMRKPSDNSSSEGKGTDH